MMIILVLRKSHARTASFNQPELFSRIVFETLIPQIESAPRQTSTTQQQIPIHNLYAVGLKNKKPISFDMGFNNFKLKTKITYGFLML